MNRVLIYVFLGFVFLQTNLFAQDVRFRAVADASEVYVGQPFRLTITMENTEVKDYRGPSFKGFEVFGPSTMSSYNWVNGKSTQSKSYTYTLRPLTEGEFIIGAASGKIDGKEVKTNPITINVIPPSGPPPTTQTPQGQSQQQGRQSQQSAPLSVEDQLAEGLFVRVIPDKTKVKVGEQITLTYKVYYKVSFRDVQVIKAPSYNGFLSHEIELDNNANAEVRENYNNQVYTTQIFKKIAIFPTHTGTYTIDPMELEGVILVQKKDPFFNHPFFNTTQPYQFKFKSNPIKIEAENLPSGAPIGFGGAVGSYDFSVELDKNSVKADDAITLKVKVSGQGNVKLVNLPKPELPHSFETYDPKTNESISKQSSIIKGSKTDEYLIIPRSGGNFEIPPLEFSYFDINKRQYVTKTSQAFSVEVEGESLLSGQSSSSGMVTKEDLKLLSDDIRYIRTGEISNRKTTFYIKSLWYPLVWGGLFLSIFPLFIFSKKHRENQKDIVALKRKKAGKVASQRLAKANKLLDSGTDKEFYQEISTSLWNYLADKMNITNAELSKENLESQLIFKGIDEQLLKKIDEIWSTCDMALYAKTTSSDRQMILEETKNTINKLEEVLI
jgi:hypothetical protein